jgi:phosphopantothenate synthetase
MNPAQRAEARRLVGEASARAALMIGKHPVTDMDGVRCALDVQHLIELYQSALDEVDRMTRGLERITHVMETIPATGSYSPLVMDEIARRLLAGREWDGSGGKK